MRRRDNVKERSLAVNEPSIKVIKWWYLIKIVSQHFQFKKQHKSHLPLVWCFSAYRFICFPLHWSEHSDTLWLEVNEKSEQSYLVLTFVLWIISVKWCWTWFWMGFAQSVYQLVPKKKNNAKPAAASWNNSFRFLSQLGTGTQEKLCC